MCLLLHTVKTDLKNYIHIPAIFKRMHATLAGLFQQANLPIPPNIPPHITSNHVDPDKLEKIMVTVIHPEDPNGPFELIQMPLQLVGRDGITDRFSFASIVDSFNHATQNHFDVRTISVLNHPDYHVPTKTRAVLESDFVEGGSLRTPFPHRVHFLVVRRST